MISLVQLLKEVQSQPKAIFMAGPAGSGKTTILNQLGLQSFKVINVDDVYEKLLKTELGKEDFTSMSPEELSAAAKLMGKARAVTKEKETQAVQSLENIIIDGTGAASKPLLKKKSDLEVMGYDTFMILLYVSPMTSLKRNAERGRSLPKSAVLKSWEGVVKILTLTDKHLAIKLLLLIMTPQDMKLILLLTLKGFKNYTLNLKENLKHLKKKLNQKQIKKKQIKKYNLF